MLSFFRCRYFRAMSKGETPPVKERLEMPVATQKTDTGLTPGLLRVLNRQVIKWYFFYDLLKGTMALRFTHIRMWLILVSRSWIWIWWNNILSFSKSLYGILFFCYSIKTKFHAKIWKDINNTQGENTIYLSHINYIIISC